MAIDDAPTSESNFECRPSQISVVAEEAKQMDDNTQVDVKLAAIELAPDRRRSSNGAAVTINDANVAAQEGKATGCFEWQTEDLVNTLGRLQTVGRIYILFLQKLALQSFIGINWPAWYLRFLRILARLSFKVPSFRIGLSRLVIPDDCISTARLLLAPALLARAVFYVLRTKENKEAIYGTIGDMLRSVVRGIAAPILLSALAIAIGVPSGVDWLTGLGVMLFWPIIGYGLIAHVARYRLWKACKSKCVRSETGIAAIRVRIQRG